MGQAFLVVLAFPVTAHFGYNDQSESSPTERTWTTTSARAKDGAMTEMTATIRNSDGIHLRPSHLILDVIADYPGAVHVESAKGQTDLRSIMDLMMMALERGTQVKIGVAGPDEDLVCQKLVDLFETEFEAGTVAQA